MKFCGLISGGKDSIMNIMHCISLGHELVCVGNLYPAAETENSSSETAPKALLCDSSGILYVDVDPEKGVEASEEIDSFMFQSVGSSLVQLIADSMGVELIRTKISGASLEVSLAI